MKDLESWLPWGLLPNLFTSKSILVMVMRRQQSFLITTFDKKSCPPKRSWRGKNKKWKTYYIVRSGHLIWQDCFQSTIMTVSCTVLCTKVAKFGHGCLGHFQSSSLPWSSCSSYQIYDHHKNHLSVPSCLSFTYFCGSKRTKVFILAAIAMCLHFTHIKKDSGRILPSKK